MIACVAVVNGGRWVGKGGKGNQDNWVTWRLFKAPYVGEQYRCRGYELDVREILRSVLRIDKRGGARGALRYSGVRVR